MLWYKGWLETRIRLVFLVGIAIFMATVQTSIRRAAPAGIQGVAMAQVALAKTVATAEVTVGIPTIVMMACALLTGAGIVTQPTFQAAKGIHGSTLFTLSLPVSRWRLLAVRAGIGWLEGVAVIAAYCAGMWLRLPGLQAMATRVEMAEYAVTLIACSSVVYGLGVLLATFLDDQWRIWGTMLGAAAIVWACLHFSLPAFADLFHAMGKGGPLIAHTMPWSAMGFSAALGAALLFAALKIARAREY